MSLLVPSVGWAAISFVGFVQVTLERNYDVPSIVSSPLSQPPLVGNANR